MFRKKSTSVESCLCNFTFTQVTKSVSFKVTPVLLIPSDYLFASLQCVSSVRRKIYIREIVFLTILYLILFYLSLTNRIDIYKTEKFI